MVNALAGHWEGVGVVGMELGLGFISVSSSVNRFVEWTFRGDVILHVVTLSSPPEEALILSTYLRSMTMTGGLFRNTSSYISTRSSAGIIKRRQLSVMLVSPIFRECSLSSIASIVPDKKIENDSSSKIEAVMV